MNARQYAIFNEGRAHAAQGGGLSGSPYADDDGRVWREGVAAGIREQAAAAETCTAAQSRQTPRPSPVAGGVNDA